MSGEAVEGLGDPAPADEPADAGRIGREPGQGGLDGGDFRLDVGVDEPLDGPAELLEDPLGRVQLRGVRRQPRRDRP